ncbi:MAG: glycine zipper 2TM domain-containing protein [Gammaproteobacteria bacterium]|nr:glycine zipper 2TM domain-containing protein [Gammaproteobacteria bacterium]MBV1731450.1 glycine zipper 2TM domain-containing protein [Hydrogenophaga sp.]
MTREERREERRDFRRRQNEPLFEAEVLSVRAVMGQSQQRCWIEREQVQQRQAPNVGGALVGAVIGGVIGHQIGGGSGRDIATAGGVVAGAAIGSQVGRDRYGNQVSTQDVQRCTNNNVSSEPAYYDVTYRFRGNTHRAQMLSPPGRSITVNRDGEPRE